MEPMFCDKGQVWEGMQGGTAVQEGGVRYLSLIHVVVQQKLNKGCWLWFLTTRHCKAIILQLNIFKLSFKKIQSIILGACYCYC